MWSPEARAAALKARRARHAAKTTAAGDRRFVKQAVKDVRHLQREAGLAQKRQAVKATLRKGKKQNVARHAAAAARYQK